jgi:excisionase family DNA binding protein
MTTQTENPFVSPQDLAAMLGVPVQTVYLWRSRGEAPRAYRIGKHVRFRLDDVEAWLEERADRVDPRVSHA